MTTDSAQVETTNETGRQLSQVNLTAVDDVPTEECSGPQRNISLRTLAEAVVRESTEKLLEMECFMTVSDWCQSNWPSSEMPGVSFRAVIFK